MAYGQHMYHYKYDEKYDDERLTPKKNSGIDISKALQTRGSVSSYEIGSTDRKSHRRQKSDGQPIISINKDNLTILQIADTERSVAKQQVREQEKKAK